MITLTTIGHKQRRNRNYRRVWPVAPTSGIGTTSPGGALHVEPPYGAAGWSYFQSNTGVAPSNSIWGLALGANRSGASSEINLVNNTSPGDGFYFDQANGGGTYTRLMTIKGSGNVGIGTTAPVAKLQVSQGQAAGTYASGSSANIDWNAGNMQSTSAAPGTITMTNMIAGASYTLVLNSGSAGNFSLSATGLNFKCLPACPITAIVSKDTIVTMIKGGTTVWVAWTPGFQ